MRIRLRSVGWALAICMWLTLPALACVQESTVTTDAPTFFMVDQVASSSIVSDFTFDLRGTSWTENLAKRDSGVSLSYAIDGAVPIEMSLPKGNRLSIRSGTLGHGVHRVDARLLVAASTVQRRAYCIYVP